MNARASGSTPHAFLAEKVRGLLEDKYGTKRLPGVRRISGDIGRANDGETISHGHVHNILNGDAENLTDRTRRLLAKFFDKPLSYFYPPDERVESAPDSVQALAARFATFSPSQIDAIKQAIEIATDPSSHQSR